MKKNKPTLMTLGLALTIVAIALVVVEPIVSDDMMAYATKKTKGSKGTDHKSGGDGGKGDASKTTGGGYVMNP